MRRSNAPRRARAASNSCRERGPLRHGSPAFRGRVPLLGGTPRLWAWALCMYTGQSCIVCVPGNLGGAGHWAPTPQASNPRPGLQRRPMPAVTESGARNGFHRDGMHSLQSQALVKSLFVPTHCLPVGACAAHPAPWPPCRPLTSRLAWYILPTHPRTLRTTPARTHTPQS